MRKAIFCLSCQTVVKVASKRNVVLPAGHAETNPHVKPNLVDRVVREKLLLSAKLAYQSVDSPYQRKCPETGMRLRHSCRLLEVGSGPCPDGMTTLTAPSGAAVRIQSRILGPTTRVGKSLGADCPRLCARTRTTFPFEYRLSCSATQCSVGVARLAA